MITGNESGTIHDHLITNDLTFTRQIGKNYLALVAKVKKLIYLCINNFVNQLC